jgi:hypothetical protein
MSYSLIGFKLSQIRERCRKERKNLILPVKERKMEGGKERKRRAERREEGKELRVLGLQM